MRERRRATRHRCRIRCTLRAGRRTDEALVLDVSLAGLLVQTKLVLAQGDHVAIEIEGGVSLEALAWHARVIRRDGKDSFVVGMMLSEVDASYEALVSRTAGPGHEAGNRARRAPPPATQPSLSVAGAAPAPQRPQRPPSLPLPRTSSWWRLRIKEVNGSRTRMVTLSAPSKEQAIAQSLAELGAGWEILDAVASGGAR